MCVSIRDIRTHFEQLALLDQSVILVTKYLVYISNGDVMRYMLWYNGERSRILDQEVKQPVFLDAGRKGLTRSNIFLKSHTV